MKAENGNLAESSKSGAKAAPAKRDGVKAVFKLGAHQHVAKVGDWITAPRCRELPDPEAETSGIGQKIKVRDVLMVSGKNLLVGDPIVEGAVVELAVSDVRRTPKVVNFKRRRRKHSSKRTKGHREFEYVLTVEGIRAPGVRAKSSSPAARPKSGTAISEESAAA